MVSSLSSGITAAPMPLCMMAMLPIPCDVSSSTTYQRDALAHFSTSRPSMNTASSIPHWPVMLTPTGHPSPARPAGTLMLGRPARDAGTVSKSWRYSLPWSPALCPPPWPSAWSRGADDWAVASGCRGAVRMAVGLRSRSTPLSRFGGWGAEDGDKGWACRNERENSARIVRRRRSAFK